MRHHKSPATKAFALHRLVLAPFRVDACAASTEGALRQLELVEEAELLHFLKENGLSALWYQRHQALGLEQRIRSTTRRDILAELPGLTARYMLQRATVERMGARLEGAKIRHAILKGVAVREQIYATPSLRPAVDIDLLVPRARVTDTIRLLVGDGMELRVDPTNVSHEAYLSDGLSGTDLHWDVLRPGRLRRDVAPGFLASRVCVEGLWTLAPGPTLFLALVHPAFSRYVNTRAAGLVKLVDLQQLVLRISDWGETIELVQACGVRAAAWATLYWLKELLATPIPDAVWKEIEPPRGRRAYLQAWLDRDLPSRLASIPGLVRAGFTLALHDELHDAVRASLRLVREKARAQMLSAELREAAKGASPRPGGP
jgi:hypothetical protein